VHPIVLELTGKTSPRTGLEGKFSVFHGAAVAILDGAGGEAQFSDQRVSAPDALALRQKVRATVDPTLGKEQARVSILLKDGTRHDLRVEHFSGSLERPLTDAELDAKFLALSTPALGSAAAPALAALRTLPQERNVADVARLCAKAS
jgi:2-methylcitrate dehydratase PrpD